MPLTRDEFFAAYKHVQVEPVELPGGQQVYVRMLSGRGRDALDVAIVRSDGFPPDFTTSSVIAFASDSEGNPLFTQVDFEAIAAMPAEVLRAIADAGRLLNGMSSAAVDEAKKNSEPDPNSGSGSALPDSGIAP